MHRINQKNPRSSQIGGIGTFLLGIIVTLLFLFTVIILFGLPGTNVASQRSIQDDIAVLINTPPSPLKPDGELAQIFTIGSDHTDLQRQLKLKEIIGKIVEWQLPVYEAKQSGNGYVVQTSDTLKGDLFGKKLVGTFIYITPQNEGDRRVVETLKTGSIISFRGKIVGTTMRNLDIRPAILVKDLNSVASPIKEAKDGVRNEMQSYKGAPTLEVDTKSNKSASTASELSSKVVANYTYDSKGQTIKIDSLVNLEEQISDCAQGLIEVTIDELDFDGASLRIVGFRAKELNGDYLYLNLDGRLYSSLSSADLSWAKEMFKKGKRVAVAYQQCGAGGKVWSIRDIYAR
jgi:hypothetical protein